MDGATESPALLPLQHPSSMEKTDLILFAPIACGQESDAIEKFQGHLRFLRKDKLAPLHSCTFEYDGLAAILNGAVDESAIDKFLIVHGERFPKERQAFNRCH